jgi:hypothetical protein
METYYNKEKVSPIFWEMMRANFCVKSLGTAVAFDEENKHHNFS